MIRYLGNALLGREKRYGLLVDYCRYRSLDYLASLYPAQAWNIDLNEIRLSGRQAETEHG
jgi:hypothetical protein